MKQKVNPLVAAVIILAAAGIVFAVMWRASEAPKWNRLPPAMAASPPGILAAAPKKPGGHAASHTAGGHSEKAKLPAGPKGDAGNAGN